ncbi:tripartite tricarboxylate transporter substrate binding protein [Metabacillus herbersteinensis]|uniref:Tripartite tricarboxylate transporter substrate binding protein n=1 Tax=Metabacillus herbersteinensis TaxID=283816 RepID=A0ABV6GIR9_9BACI
MKKSKLLIMISLLTAFMFGCSANTSNEASDNNTGEQAEFTPEGPIRYIVGFAPGGGTDLAARTVARTLNESGIVEESFAVENLTGGGGVRALMELSNKGDGNTLLQSVDIYSPMYMEGSKLKLDQFIPVAQVANNSLLLVVSKNSEYKSVDELFNAIKEDPGKVSIGLPAATDTVEVVKWNEIAKSYGIASELKYIPHNGISEVIPELLSGRIDAALLVPPVAKGYLDSKELNALAAMSDERLEVLPDIPTLKEQGIDVTFYRPQGVFLKAGVGEEVVAYWENALKEMTESEEWKTFINNQMYINEFKGSEEYTEWMETEGKNYSEFLKGKK